MAVNIIKVETNQIQCPICLEMVDYLVGDNTKDGGVRGCEKDWKPDNPPKPNE